MIGFLRVLLLGGEREFAHAFAGLVRAFGHEVEVHDDEQAAIEAARTLPPHVVFVDHTSAATDGRELCQVVREELPQPPRLVAITADTASDVMSACRDAGFDFRFSKPLVAGELERFLAVSKDELL
jgi:CheY-like chemotaxis protein